MNNEEMLTELQVMLGRSLPFEIWNEDTKEVIISVNQVIEEKNLLKIIEQIPYLAYSGLDEIMTPTIAKYALPSTKIFQRNLEHDPNMIRAWIINRYNPGSDIPTDLGREEWKVEWWDKRSSKMQWIDPLEVILVAREEVESRQRIPLDAIALCFFLKNPHLIPRYWKDKRIILFDGTIFSAGSSRKHRMKNLMEALAPKEMHKDISYIAGITDSEKPVYFTLALKFQAMKWYWCCCDAYHYELKRFEVATL